MVASSCYAVDRLVMLFGAGAFITAEGKEDPLFASLFKLSSSNH